MRRIVGAGFTIAAVAASATAAIPQVAAVADPSHGHNVTTGTANCGTAGSFTFVVTENSGNGTAWNVAFLTSTASGTRALFHPSSFDLTFTSPAGTFHEDVAKAKGPGPVSCTIASMLAPGVTLSGTVTGTLTRRG